jgi:BASS family bile acid:Na+ symporter
MSPLLAFGMAQLFGLRPIYAVGLVILGASPGGVLANLLTHLARGETALSISLTATSSLLSVVTIPLYLGLAITQFGAESLSDDVSALGIALRVLLITTVPLLIGMRLRATRPERALALQRPLGRAAMVAFAAAVTATFVAERERLGEAVGEVLPAAAALSIAAMTISFAVALLAGLPDRSATAISLELGVHNGAVAIAAAETISSDLAIPAAVYSVFMLIPAGILVTWRRRMRETGADPAPSARSA